MLISLASTTAGCLAVTLENICAVIAQRKVRIEHRTYSCYLCRSMCDAT